MSSIEFHNLRKAYKDLVAVSDLSVTVEAGRITGFLGPNGAGKSTALKCLLGLANPTSGTCLLKGKKYSELDHPGKMVGAVLDSSGFNQALTAKQNLKVICAANDIDDSRIEPTLKLVELDYVANKRTKGFSLGMKQRLSLAAALISDPEILVLDEPANGLDPVGIAWLRDLLRDLAKQGKTILVSSHQLAEMQHTVDDVVIINQGEMIAAGPLKKIIGKKTLEEAFLDLVRDKK